MIKHRLCEMVPKIHLVNDGPYRMVFIENCKEIEIKEVNTREEALVLYNKWMSGDE